MKRWFRGLLAFAILFWSLTIQAAAPSEKVLAIYLPGVYFAQLERKLDLGSELVAHLLKRLGDKYHLSPRVYVSAEAMDADAARIAMVLTESPYVAANLTKLLPVAVAAAGNGTETRMALLATPTIRSLPDLKRGGLVFASSLEPAQSFLDNFVFEGELTLSRDMMSPVRDVASALSLLSVQKAQAVLLYEDTIATVRTANLRTLYRSDQLPRPTLVLTSRSTDPADVQKLREALTSFHGQVHPDIKGFRATTDQPYQKLRDRMQQKPRRNPQLLLIEDDTSPLPTPRTNLPSPVQVPLRAFAPEG
ncbi:MAG TPA: PhnD/SsuA/transferrin family substrate-binding protein [Pseudomonadota bacterium]|jgi:hypothetical protein|nr:PhnD/SsuA/transferrin family substrate-binding protein [Pseudomonadota bacterium]